MDVVRRWMRNERGEFFVALQVVLLAIICRSCSWLSSCSGHARSRACPG